MAQVKEKVYHEDSDSYSIRYRYTEKTIQREKYLSKFDVDEVREFITEKSRRSYGHICNQCKNKNFCDKWNGKIILQCDEVRR